MHADNGGVPTEERGGTRSVAPCEGGFYGLAGWVLIMSRKPCRVVSFLAEVE